MATKEQIKAQWIKIREALDGVYGPLAAFEDECQVLNEMLGLTDEESKDDAVEEAPENPPESGGGRGG